MHLQDGLATQLHAHGSMSYAHRMHSLTMVALESGDCLPVKSTLPHSLQGAEDNRQAQTGCVRVFLFSFRVFCFSGSVLRISAAKHHLPALGMGWAVNSRGRRGRCSQSPGRSERIEAVGTKADACRKRRQEGKNSLVQYNRPARLLPQNLRLSFPFIPFRWSAWPDLA